MKRKHYILILLLALLSSGVAIFMTKQHIDAVVANVKSEVSETNDFVPVVVASIDMSIGDEINIDALAMREIPSTFVGDNAFAPEDIESLLGRKLLFNLKAGTPILPAHLQASAIYRFSDYVPLGYRAVTISVDELSGNSGLLQPGDRIDIYQVSYAVSGSVSQLLFANVQVMSIGQDIDDGIDEQQPFNAITVAIHNSEMKKMISAREKSELSLVLRNKEEAEMKLKSQRVKTQNNKFVEKKTNLEIEWIVGGDKNG